LTALSSLAVGCLTANYPKRLSSVNDLTCGRVKAGNPRTSFSKGMSQTRWGLARNSRRPWPPVAISIESGKVFIFVKLKRYKMKAHIAKGEIKKFAIDLQTIDSLDIENTQLASNILAKFIQDFTFTGKGILFILQWHIVVKLKDSENILIDFIYETIYNVFEVGQDIEIAHNIAEIYIENDFNWMIESYSKKGNLNILPPLNKGEVAASLVQLLIQNNNY
jgi:hypothetical protein